jgi:hypothetical protein
VTTRDRRMRKFFFLVNWWARQVQEVGTDVGEKTIRFCHKRSPNCNFLILHSPSTYPLSITYDGWDRHEGYGGPDLGEKSFQLFSLLIV